MKLMLVFLRNISFAMLIIISNVCKHSSNTNSNTNDNVTSDNASGPILKNKKIKICSFNIQNLGVTKLNKPDVTKNLVAIIRKYDIVAVQEISDANNTAGQKFLDSLNEGQIAKYNMVLSPRSGQQPKNKKGQEQYAFYYNTSTITDLGLSRLYNDSVYDYFKREPFLGHFKVKDGKFSFVLCTVHTDPDFATSEIDALDEVVKWAKSWYKKEDDYIILGDFNASCGYAKSAQLNVLAIRKNYHWLIVDSVNTNLASKDCAYDRIVITPATNSDYTGMWGVDRCFVNKSISDHWPVWAEFYVNKDTLSVSSK